jgi:hypothetical protein
MMVVIFGCRDTMKLRVDLADKYVSYCLHLSRATTDAAIISHADSVLTGVDSIFVWTRIQRRSRTISELELIAKSYNRAAAQVDSLDLKKWDLPTKVATSIEWPPRAPAQSSLRTFAIIK